MQVQTFPNKEIPGDDFRHTLSSEKFNGVFDAIKNSIFKTHLS
jgi:hypothetical protein|tara:strand:+ start:923 stop:1051 length:129 start_codon:yes stop_codon:yes gene_type:complete